MTVRKTYVSVRESDKNASGRQAAELDLTQPLPPEPQLNLGWLLELPAKAIDRAVVDQLEAEGFADIRPAHGKVFTTVSGEGSRITDMASEAMLTKQSMQYLVDDLERLGYAERVPDPADRRAKLVRLTPKGRRVVLSGRAAIAHTEARWRRQLGERKMARLRTLLEELVVLIGDARAPR